MRASAFSGLACAALNFFRNHAVEGLHEFGLLLEKFVQLVFFQLQDLDLAVGNDRVLPGFPGQQGTFSKRIAVLDLVDDLLPSLFVQLHHPGRSRVEEKHAFRWGVLLENHKVPGTKPGSEAPGEHALRLFVQPVEQIASVDEVHLLFERDFGHVLSEKEDRFDKGDLVSRLEDGLLQPGGRRQRRRFSSSGPRRRNVPSHNRRRHECEKPWGRSTPGRRPLPCVLSSGASRPVGQWSCWLNPQSPGESVERGGGPACPVPPGSQAGRSPGCRLPRQLPEADAEAALRARSIAFPSGPAEGPPFSPMPGFCLSLSSMILLYLSCGRHCASCSEPEEAGRRRRVSRPGGVMDRRLYAAASPGALMQPGPVKSCHPADMNFLSPVRKRTSCSSLWRRTFFRSNGVSVEPSGPPVRTPAEGVVECRPGAMQLLQAAGVISAKAGIRVLCDLPAPGLRRW